MDEVAENHNNYLERVNLYKKFGYDIEQERAFIFKIAQPIAGKILEVGTGKGHFTIQLAKEGYRFTSIDISAKEQNNAKLNIKYLNLESLVDFKLENAKSLSFKDNSFDIVFSINAMHHLPNLTKVIDEMTRVLAPKGKIILSDFTQEGFKLIEKIHESEGRKHGFPQDTLTNAISYLKNKVFKVDIYKTKYQEIAVAYR
jgi:ubiquinone/menaquinone biosynthesis C-methylase UbiE